MAKIECQTDDEDDVLDDTDDVPDDILNQYITDNEINILVMNNDDIFQCTIRESTSLVSYLSTFTDKSSAILFFYNGEEINISDTPKSMGMSEGDMINIFTSE